MQITTAKLKNADGSFEYLGIGADANYITLKNGENFEEAASEVNNNTSNMDLTYQILDKELKTSTPVDVELNRNIAEFSSRDPQTNVIKTNRAKVKNEDGWSEDIPIAAAAVNIDLNNGNNAEDTFENLEVKLNKLNEKYDELKSLVSTVVEGDPVTVDSSGMDYMDTIVYGNSEQKTYSGKNLYNNTIYSRTTGNLDLIANNDGTIIINGTNDEGNLVFNSNRFSLKAGTYIASGMPEGTSTSTVYIQFSYQDENGNNPYITADNHTFTVSKDVDNFICFIGVKSGVTANKIILKPMIRLASITDNTYEPYVGGQVSPNPDYPQDIEVIDGVNLFDGELELGFIGGNDGNNRTHSDYTRCKNFIPVNELTRYKLTSPDISNNIFIYEYKKDYSYNLVSNKSLSQSYYFATEKDTAFIKFRPSITIADGGTLDTKYMLTKGTTKKPYLPYGCIGLEQSGKNLFDKDNITIGGYLGVSGQIIQSENSFYTDYIDVLNISGLITYSGSSENGDKERIICYDKNKNVVDYFLTKTRNINVTDFAFIRISDNIQYLDTIQLEFNSEATDYEPYHSPKLYPINLNGNSIAKVGDVKDLLKIYRNGEVEIEKLRNRYVFIGNEHGWKEKEKTNTVVYFFKMDKTAKDMLYSSQLCNIFVNKNIYNLDEEGFYVSQSGYFIVSIDKARLNSFNNQKVLDFLVEHNTEVYYELAESETIKLSSIEPIEPWEGTNIFKLITNLDTTMQIDYYKSYEKYVISNIDF